MSNYNIHSDFKKYQNMKTPLVPILLPLMNGVIEKSFNNRKSDQGVREIRRRIPGYHDEPIELRIYEPEAVEGELPCLIYLHGGAFVLKSAAFHKHLVCQYALRTPCKVVFVDYRLAPKQPFPVGVEDCFAALKWIDQNAAGIGIDPNKIAIGGDSAGGALAAAVCLMARDRIAPKICFQMLIYPVTDARQMTESVKEFTDTPLWNAKLNQKMWKLYLRQGFHSNKEYASPMEATSLENLPDAYIEVAEFDCLRDEGINFAEALKKSGIQVELNRTTGTIHGFEIAEDSEIVHQSVIKRVVALKNAFAD
ncbi:alpha/beta hydrolase [Acetobacterium paludosum]|nr:alpha/beta hydrolase [Acetobacterium paludosum]